MKKTYLILSMLTAVFLMDAPTASATITSVERSGEIRRNQTTTLTLRGQFLDFSHAFDHFNRPSTVEGSGVTARTIARRSDGIDISFTVSQSASLGPRRVTLHYTVETSGPDTFNIVITRNGRLTGIFPTEVRPDGEQFIAFTINGTDIGNAIIDTISPADKVVSSSALESTDNQFRVRIRFKRNTGSTRIQAAILLKEGGGLINKNLYTPSVVVFLLPEAPTGCISDPTPESLSKTSPENNSTVTPSPGSTRVSVSFRWNLGNLSDQQRQSEKIIFTLQEGSGFVQRTELSAGTTSRSVQLNRGATYRWNVFAFNCGVPPPNSDEFQPFTVIVRR